MQTGSYKKEFPKFFSDYFSGTKALVVEDNFINQKITTKTLEKFGFFVTMANNGREALNYLSSDDFDIVLMDCQMPVMDGFQTTFQIRSYLKQKKNIPIIGVTANASRDNIRRCLQVGMNACVLKPFIVSELLSNIDLQLERVRKER